MDEIQVYAWLDDNKGIIRLESSIFFTGQGYSVVLDKGHGDKYAHCQSNYLEDGIYDSNGRPNYKYVEGEGAVKLTGEEKELLYPVENEEPVEDEESLSEIAMQLMIENAEIKMKQKEQDELMLQLLEDSAKGGVQ